MRILHAGASITLGVALAAAATAGACSSEADGDGATSTTAASTTSTTSGGQTSSSATGSGSGGDPGDGSSASSSDSTSSGGECNVAADCDDGDSCTDDACSDGVCNHFEIGDIDDDDVCTVDSCNSDGEVIHTPIDGIDDGDACTADVCDPDTGDITHDGDGCNDGDVCTADSCDGAGTCTNAPGGCSPTYAGVQPIFQAKCTPCHEGGTAEGCAGSTCFVNHYDATQLILSGGPCDGQLAADCIAQTINDGSMPKGVTCTGDPVRDAGEPRCVLAEEQTVIEQWVGAGAPP